MKVLLLNPPTRNRKRYIREGRCTQEQGFWATLWPPVSLASTAAVLEHDGHEISALDCPAHGINWETLLKIVKQIRPHCVVWSTGTPTIVDDLSLAAAIKEIDASIRTAVFGTHVTALDRESLSFEPALDIIIRQEPELTAKALINALAYGEPLDEVLGITYRNGTGMIYKNPDRPFIDDLDQLPFPAWHLLNIADYCLPLKGRPFLIIAPQRGCPYQCSFCTCQTYYGKRVRRRSIASVLKEMRHDIEHFRIKDFFIWAETFVIDREYVAALCTEIINQGLRVAWTCNSRVDTVDEALLKSMAQAGCWMISFGIESADQEVLNRAAKGIRVEQARNAVALARKAGIKTAGHFIFGLPGETPESIKRTIQFAKELDLDIAQFYCCVPFPGSRLYEQALHEGWIRGTAFSCFAQTCAAMRLPTVSPEQVEHARRKAYRSFYSRPRTWLKVGTMLADGTLLGAWQALRRFLR
ncbi:MAG: B12-binding domain-containing radical SAM protein [Desulfobacterota bacterium]|nr:B12-binding domain-containing radical SAM protein [Thermodesulfobacteriota bacterium]